MKKILSLKKEAKKIYDIINRKNINFSKEQKKMKNCMVQLKPKEIIKRYRKINKIRNKTLTN